MMAFVKKLFSKPALLADLAEAAAPIMPPPPRVVLCALHATSATRTYATFADLLAATGTLRLIPAAFLAQKAKSVSDGIFATLERFSSDGDDRNMGISALLERLEACFAEGGSVRDYLSVARDLDRYSSPPRAREFLRDSLRSKPLGFYTWSGSLERAFQRDRFLQQQLPEASAEVIAGALATDERAGKAYGQHLARIARLTNTLSDSTDSLIPRVLCARERRAFRTDPTRIAAFFPPSKTFENGFGSMSQFFAQVREARCDLTPAPSSGFYAHQLYALEPLLAPDRAPEAAERKVDPGYAQALERLAGAALFFGRETHVKQLELAPGCAARQPERWALPGLTIEPVPTFYARTAAAFRFLRDVVEEGWGNVALAAPQMREHGLIARTLSEGISEVVELCEAAGALSLLELAGEGQGEDVESLRARLRSLASDPDVTLDARGMVPLGLLPPPDPRIRALVFAGWEVHDLEVTMTHLRFRPPGVALGKERHPLPVPVVREIVVEPDALLDRAAFRRHLDSGRSR